MTKQRETRISALPQPPQAEGAGAPAEIEITPAMIEAGVDAYLGYCPDTGLGDATDRRMVAAVYRAMREVRH